MNSTVLAGVLSVAVLILGGGSGGASTEELTGIAGTMTIDIKDGKHFYALDYTLP